MNRKETGNAGEALACEILHRQGFRILQRNFRCTYGEIDIIAVKGKHILFAEVKTRLSDGFGQGREAVDRNKRRRIRMAAKHFLVGSDLRYDDVEFQVIEIHVAQISDLFD